MGKFSNPFVNNKSRKRRKKPVITKPKPQGYCPNSMIKYDSSPNTTSSVWVCKLCLRCIMTEKTVREHILTCNTKPKKNQIQSSMFTTVLDDTRYICKQCNRDFSRLVALKKHEELHEKHSTDEESDSDSSDIREAE